MLKTFQSVLNACISTNYILATECDTEEVEHEGMKEWLKQHLDPISTAKEYMEKTVINRAHWIRDNIDLDVKDIMREYPRLFDIPEMVCLQTFASGTYTVNLVLTNYSAFAMVFFLMASHQCIVQLSEIRN